MTEQTLKDVSQRNPADPTPDSDDVFGRMFRRGPTVAADGGEHGARAKREAGDAREGADDAADAPPVAEQTLKDVDQTPPHEESNSNRVWERGGEQAVGDEATGERDDEAASERDDEDDYVDATERADEDAGDE